jgi:hypothetical protein
VLNLQEVAADEAWLKIDFDFAVLFFKLAPTLESAENKHRKFTGILVRNPLLE